MTGSKPIAVLRQAGVARGDLVALTIAPGVGIGLATATVSMAIPADPTLVRAIEDALRPRWVWWSNETAAVLVAAGIRVATCWDLAAVHRLVHGGYRADPGRVWALAHDLPIDTMPVDVPDNLFSLAEDLGDPDDPARPDGYLRPGWVSGDWRSSADHLARWAELALSVAELQQAQLATVPDRPKAPATARSESAAELLCVELSRHGLPMDRTAAETLISSLIGPRPTSAAEAAEGRRRRDAEVLRHVPGSEGIDLRSPGQVRNLLRRVGIDVSDTRAWRLRQVQDRHPVVEALLTWRKAERVSTTYGYAWLDEHLGEDGKLRGAWTGCDGAAGRMTASNGLHNMPAEMRQAVVAEQGHVFVRADLGQIEPRVLAAVSRDSALARACAADDLYAPVASALAVDRATAKVAVLGAMYGQTTGDGARALHRLKATYPVAMGYLDEADRSAQGGRDLRTYGGRLIQMSAGSEGLLDERAARSRAAARGRYGRNAMVQGAAAELFKLWAVIVRSRISALGGPIVLCLHDELLLHVPAGHADEAVVLLEECLAEAVGRWAPDDSVRFLAEIAVLRRWSDAHEDDPV